MRRARQRSERELNALRLVLAIALAGSVIGLVGALFLMALRSADTARVALISLAEQSLFPSWLAAVILCVLGASLAAWLANRFAPDSPQTAEAASGDDPVRPVSDLGRFGTNFAGASLAVGAGLALGPERPAIQMGAVMGRTISRLVRLGDSEREIFVAAAGGAGVATMFNSPLGCAAYTVEAVIKRVDFHIAAITLGMGGIAVAVTRLLIGRDFNFVIEALTPVSIPHLPLYFVLGALIALAGNLHVRLIVAFARSGRELLPRPAIRAAVVGGAVGLLAWYAPNLVGTGEAMTQTVLDGRIALSTLGAVFLVRFVLGPLSLSAGTPGGYFTPVLLLGATFGSMVGALASLGLPASDVTPTAFAVVGMAVALASVANAPFTGILLVIETTGAIALSLPMTVAVLGAMGADRLLKQPSLTHGLEIALRPVKGAGDSPSGGPAA